MKYGIEHGNGYDHAPNPNSRVRGIWRHMRERCSNPKCDNYRHYGGRGIRVCDRWQGSFENFLSDMGLPPSDKHSIDRIDGDGNYEPGNCRWATRIEQARNKRGARIVHAFGEAKCVKAWAEDPRSVVAMATMLQRLNLGWLAEKAITTPADTSRAFKMTWAKAREIRRRAQAGEKRPALAKDFGISEYTIGSVIRNDVWRTADDPGCGPVPGTEPHVAVAAEVFGLAGAVVSVPPVDVVG